LDKYAKLDKLGEGTYGLVFKARNNETGEVSFESNSDWLINYNLESCYWAIFAIFL